MSVNMNMFSNLTTYYDNVTHASSYTKEQLDTTSWYENFT